MEESPAPSARVVTPRYPTLRGVLTCLVGLIAVAVVLAAVVADGRDGPGGRDALDVHEAQRVASPDGTDAGTANRFGDGPGGSVDHGVAAARHLALDLLWHDMSSEERERFCTDYERSGLVATYELFAAGYAGEAVPGLTVFRRWIEPRCGA